MADVSSAESRWGSTGLAYLTGLSHGPPDFSRSSVLTRADRIAADTSVRLGVAVDAATLLTGRAGLLRLSRRGRISAGGATRLLTARDGWCAITLSRPEDVAAVPALLQADEVHVDPWPALRCWAARQYASVITERAGLLDIPAATLGEVAAAPPGVRRVGAGAQARGVAGLLVADLSSMWAGPLCGRLLARAGATVIKVESPRRPDGTRTGDRAVFDWLNSEKLSYCVDFDHQADELRALLSVCDIVIEGSRPAALARRRLGPDDVPAQGGRIWLRINGYDAQPSRPAFGDDAAVAGGLVGDSVNGPVFCGDAIADPLAGMESTLVVTESLGRGGGELISVSMAAVAATYAALPHRCPGASVSAHSAPPPSVPPAAKSAAAELGADNGTVRCLVSKKRCRPC